MTVDPEDPPLSDVDMEIPPDDNEGSVHSEDYSFNMGSLSSSNESETDSVNEDEDHETTSADGSLLDDLLSPMDGTDDESYIYRIRNVKNPKPLKIRSDRGGLALEVASKEYR